MRVFLRNTDGNVCSIEIESSEEIASVNAKIEEKTGIPPIRQRLLYAGYLLGTSGSKVSDYNIPDGATIYISHRGPLALPGK